MLLGYQKLQIDLVDMLELLQKSNISKEPYPVVLYVDTPDLDETVEIYRGSIEEVMAIQKDIDLHVWHVVKMTHLDNPEQWGVQLELREKKEDAGGN